jgi:hypothetical protein
MFLNNKYTSWYWSIITRAQSRVLCVPQYTERHHIVPRCMGGSNAKSNLVILTAKEHYIVHLLLTKMAQGRNKYKLQVALWRMCSFKDGRHVPSNRAYESAKLNMATALSVLNTGKPLPIAQREAMKGKPAHNKGKKMPKSHGAKIAAYRKGRVCAQSTAYKISNTLKSKGSDGNSSPRKGQPCPKYKWILKNQITSEVETTTNLKTWCKCKSFSDVTFYHGRTDWIIIEKYKLRDNTRLI